MKNLMHVFLLIVFFSLFCNYSCKEEKGPIIYTDDSLAPPAPITIVEVTSKPGGAIIKYKIPDDDNLLGVKVVYIRNGKVCESKASRYVDTLAVEGFGSTDPQEIKLYSVGINGKLSEPVSAVIHPLNPPVKTIKFDMNASFGGVVISLEENCSHADLALVLIADTIGNSNNNKHMIELQTFHTKSKAMKFSRRGLKPQPTYFGLYVRDRWNNVSDTIFKILTPVEEIKLPKTEFRNAALPSDYFSPAEGSSGYRLENIWDGTEDPSGPFYASSHSAPIPQWFTIDLGHKMSISRIQKWPRAEYELYSGSGPRVFQVWGSDNPNPDGSWDESWHLLGEFEQFKPSGYGEGREIGPITDEDRDYWYYRTEFELVPTEQAPDPYQTVTHLRFKILSTFSTYGTEATMGQVIIGELTFWGQLKD